MDAAGARESGPRHGSVSYYLTTRWPSCACRTNGSSPAESTRCRSLCGEQTKPGLAREAWGAHDYLVGSCMARRSALRRFCGRAGVARGFAGRNRHSCDAGACSIGENYASSHAGTRRDSRLTSSIRGSRNQAQRTASDGTTLEAASITLPFAVNRSKAAASPGCADFLLRSSRRARSSDGRVPEKPEGMSGGCHGAAL